MNTTQLHSLVARFNKLLMLLAVSSLALMVGMVIVNVLSRYVLHVSLTWSSELARYAMIWSAMLGAAVLVNKEQHLTVDIIERFLGPRARTAVLVLVNFGSMTFYLVVLASGALLVVRTAGQVAASMEWLPMNIVYVIIPLSSLLMLLGAAVVLVRILGDEVTR